MKMLMFLGLVLGVGGLVVAIWWMTLRALVSRQSGHAGPVQDARHNAPLPKAVEPLQANHADHHLDDWEQGLHESSASSAEWDDQSDHRPVDYHEDIRAGDDKI